MNNINYGVLVPILLYFLVIFAVGFYSMRFVNEARNSKDKENGFMDEYMTGSRGLGGFVLAMTLVTTYLSAGSFIGGPGTAYTQGLGWVFLAMAQMPTGYFTLAVLGKKFAIIARKINAVTITDFLRARYKSDAVVIITSLSIVVFFIAAMAAQWVGASRLLQGSVGLDYNIALTVFGITVIVHTVIGGFRAVTISDTIQGVIMTIATITIFIGTIIAGGGVENIITNMASINEGMITPFGVTEGNMTILWVTSFWILVGFAVVGIPSVSQRAMSYKDTKSLHQGIKYGTIISMILLLGMHLVGAFAITLVSGIDSGDLVIPTLTTKLFPSIVAGILLAGPLASIMSTVDSQLLVASGTIVNDLYTNYINPKIKKDSKKMGKVSILATSIIGIAIYLVAFNPPDLIVWLNLYANAGIISTFLWPIVLGLYWKNANSNGAIASIISGISTYVLFSEIWPRPFGLHTIVLPLLISLVLFIIVSSITKRPDKETIETFWGIYYKD
ncbi:sodium/panthothenate symporter [Romboutsia ilealis]|uniref:Sodium/panthothenate symporter n=1 Tax=Romboutsia faecis TaxID=2764597 RepID=A0ABR7JNB7_9FIRM|nr:sodium/pantothenate symporter [Romboutsia faecis]MBC5996407.1 sodium/panthothenate symporter [Romboutsia faecis]MRN26014.1 sodium/panthothenate symporter [Romboutsia ilealis]